MTNESKIGISVDTASFIGYCTEKTYSETTVNKLLAGIHMLGGTVCECCGTVHLRGTKCPICVIKKYL